MAPQPQNQPTRKGHNWGAIITIILLSLLLLGSLAFGFWAFASRQDYKDHSDKKAAAAAALAKQQEASVKEKEFVEREKSPLKEYKGPASYGSLDIKYPKTWSAYVVETSSGTNNIDGTFHPSFVPSTTSGTDFALRTQVVSQQYAQVVKLFDGQLKSGAVKIAPYVSPKQPGITGVRVTGEVKKGQQVTMVILPLRDKTIKIWTESPQFVGDFDNIIMSNFTFVP